MLCASCFLSIESYFTRPSLLSSLNSSSGSSSISSAWATFIYSYSGLTSFASVTLRIFINPPCDLDPTATLFELFGRFFLLYVFFSTGSLSSSSSSKSSKSEPSYLSKSMIPRSSESVLACKFWILDSLSLILSSSFACFLTVFPADELSTSSSMLSSKKSMRRFCG